MRLLLDTHAVLWMLSDPMKLSPTARTAVALPENDVYASAASVWEVAIKVRAGKLVVPIAWSERLTDIGVTPLAISFEHALIAGGLPPIHFDPFDRMIVAQGQVEQMTIVTRDRHIVQYSTPTLTA